MVTWSRPALGAGLVVTLTLASTLPVAGAFTAVEPNPLRGGSVIRLGDIAAVGNDVIVGWREGRDPGQLVVALSRNGGRSFLRGNGNLRTYPVAGLGRSGISLEICGGSMWAGTAARFPGDAPRDSDVLLWRRGLNGGAGQVFLTAPGASRRVRDVEIACVGNRLLAIAWLEQSGGQARGRLLLRDLGTLAPSAVAPSAVAPSAVSTSALSPSATNSFTNLGPAGIRDGISVAATGNRVFVSWSSGNQRSLRLKRFDIGQGEDPTIAPRPTERLASGDAVRPKLAARGRKVILAYSDDGKLKAKVSTDAGASFGPQVVLIPNGTIDIPSFATSAALSGSRIVLAAMKKQPNADEQRYRPVRLESTDTGASWASSGELGNRGPRMAALQKVSNSLSRIKEAWHDDGPSLDTLRAQREVG